MTTKNSTITTTSHHIEFLTDTGIRIEATIVIADRGRIDSCVIHGCSETKAFTLNLDIAGFVPIYQFPARVVCNAARSYHAIESRVDIDGHDLALTEVLDPVVENLRYSVSTLLVELSFVAEQHTRDQAQSIGYALRDCIVTNCTVEITKTFKSI